ncbi:dual specificity phosphatase-like protein [Hyaloscypha hepaticicola]|uniref:Dual specificity phosphatase-like protein n=1 Tax=Hyaloscypha hepaticicola TaxID=2082293 RepID=A0A2J6QAS5_9HELO|nr:dual specificity phosphatase-like protein [Hyaloscypha hepaticicola]
MVTASQLTGATPVGGYSWRPPSPPHIHVPQAPEDRELVLPAYNGISCASEEREILKLVTQNHKVVAGVKEWKYEMRRSAQAIQPFLYLGPSSAARDLDFLRREGITLLLVIRNTMTAAVRLLSGEKVARELGIQSAAVDVAGNQELIAAFPRACKIINDHLIFRFREGMAKNTTNPEPGAIQGKVLVFCESGNERSAAVVAAYLMNMFGLDLVSAIQYVQSQRFCVAFDDGLKNLLLNYEELLKAQRCVSAATMTSQTTSVRNHAKPKRPREESSGDDMEMCLDDSDDERFANRGGFVPFQDNGAS